MAGKELNVGIGKGSNYTPKTVFEELRDIERRSSLYSQSTYDYLKQWGNTDEYLNALALIDTGAATSATFDKELFDNLAYDPQAQTDYLYSQYFLDNEDDKIQYNEIYKGVAEQLKKDKAFDALSDAQKFFKTLGVGFLETLAVIPTSLYDGVAGILNAATYIASPFISLAEGKGFNPTWDYSLIKGSKVEEVTGQIRSGIGESTYLRTEFKGKDELGNLQFGTESEAWGIIQQITDGVAPMLISLIPGNPLGGTKTIGQLLYGGQMFGGVVQGTIAEEDFFNYDSNKQTALVISNLATEFGTELLFKSGPFDKGLFNLSGKVTNAVAGKTSSQFVKSLSRVLVAGFEEGFEELVNEIAQTGLEGVIKTGSLKGWEWAKPEDVAMAATIGAISGLMFNTIAIKSTKPITIETANGNITLNQIDSYLVNELEQGKTLDEILNFQTEQTRLTQQLIRETGMTAEQLRSSEQYREAYDAAVAQDEHSARKLLNQAGVLVAALETYGTNSLGQALDLTAQSWISKLERLQQFVTTNKAHQEGVAARFNATHEGLNIEIVPTSVNNKVQLDNLKFILNTDNAFVVRPGTVGNADFNGWTVFSETHENGTTETTLFVEESYLTGDKPFEIVQEAIIRDTISNEFLGADARFGLMAEKGYDVRNDKSWKQWKKTSDLIKQFGIEPSKRVYMRPENDVEYANDLLFSPNMIAAAAQCDHGMFRKGLDSITSMIRKLKTKSNPGSKLVKNTLYKSYKQYVQTALNTAMEYVTEHADEDLPFSLADLKDAAFDLESMNVLKSIDSEKLNSLLNSIMTIPETALNRVFVEKVQTELVEFAKTIGVEISDPDNFDFRTIALEYLQSLGRDVTDMPRSNVISMFRSVLVLRHCELSIQGHIMPAYVVGLKNKISYIKQNNTPEAIDYMENLKKNGEAAFIDNSKIFASDIMKTGVMDNILLVSAGKDTHRYDNGLGVTCNGYLAVNMTDYLANIKSIIVRNSIKTAGIRLISQVFANNVFIQGTNINTSIDAINDVLRLSQEDLVNLKMCIQNSMLDSQQVFDDPSQLRSAVDKIADYFASKNNIPFNIGFVAADDQSTKNLDTCWHEAQHAIQVIFKLEHGTNPDFIYSQLLSRNLNGFIKRISGIDMDNIEDVMNFGTKKNKNIRKIKDNIKDVRDRLLIEVQMLISDLSLIGIRSRTIMALKYYKNKFNLSSEEIIDRQYDTSNPLITATQVISNIGDMFKELKKFSSEILYYLNRGEFFARVSGGSEVSVSGDEFIDTVNRTPLWKTTRDNSKMIPNEAAVYFFDTLRNLGLIDDISTDDSVRDNSAYSYQTKEQFNRNAMSMNLGYGGHYNLEERAKTFAGILEKAGLTTEKKILEYGFSGTIASFIDKEGVNHITSSDVRNCILQNDIGNERAWNFVLDALYPDSKIRDVEGNTIWEKISNANALLPMITKMKPADKVFTTAEIWANENINMNAPESSPGESALFILRMTGDVLTPVHGKEFAKQASLGFKAINQEIGLETYNSEGEAYNRADAAGISTKSAEDTYIEQEEAAGRESLDEAIEDDGYVREGMTGEKLLEMARRDAEIKTDKELHTIINRIDQPKPRTDFINRFGKKVYDQLKLIQGKGINVKGTMQRIYDIRTRLMREGYDISKLPEPAGKDKSKQTDEYYGYHSSNARLLEVKNLYQAALEDLRKQQREGTYSVIEQRAKAAKNSEIVQRTETNRKDVGAAIRQDILGENAIVENTTRREDVNIEAKTDELENLADNQRRERNKRQDAEREYSKNLEKYRSIKKSAALKDFDWRPWYDIEMLNSFGRSIMSEAEYNEYLRAAEREQKPEPDKIFNSETETKLETTKNDATKLESDKGMNIDSTEVELAVEDELNAIDSGKTEIPERLLKMGLDNLAALKKWVSDRYLNMDNIEENRSDSEQLSLLVGIIESYLNHIDNKTVVETKHTTDPLPKDLLDLGFDTWDSVEKYIYRGYKLRNENSYTKLDLPAVYHAYLLKLLNKLTSNSPKTVLDIKKWNANRTKQIKPSKEQTVKSLRRGDAVTVGNINTNPEPVSDVQRRLNNLNLRQGAQQTTISRDVIAPKNINTTQTVTSTVETSQPTSKPSRTSIQSSNPFIQQYESAGFTKSFAEQLNAADVTNKPMTRETFERIVRRRGFEAIMTDIRNIHTWNIILGAVYPDCATFQNGEQVVAFIDNVTNIALDTKMEDGALMLDSFNVDMTDKSAIVDGEIKINGALVTALNSTEPLNIVGDIREVLYKNNSESAELRILCYAQRLYQAGIPVQKLVDVLFEGGQLNYSVDESMQELNSLSKYTATRQNIDQNNLQEVPAESLQPDRETQRPSPRIGRQTDNAVDASKPKTEPKTEKKEDKKSKSFFSRILNFKPVSAKEAGKSQAAQIRDQFRREIGAMSAQDIITFANAVVATANGDSDVLGLGEITDDAILPLLVTLTEMSLLYKGTDLQNKKVQNAINRAKTSITHSAQPAANASTLAKLQEAERATFTDAIRNDAINAGIRISEKLLTEYDAAVAKDDFKTMKKVADKIRDEFIENSPTIRDLIKTGNPDDFKKAVMMLVRKARSFRMWAMLSSPSTGVKNAVSNSALTVADRISESIANPIEKKINQVYKSEYSTIRHGKIKQEVKDFIKTRFENNGRLDYEVGGSKYATGESIAETVQKFYPWKSKVMRALQKMESFMLDTGDVVFVKSYAKRMLENILNNVTDINQLNEEQLELILRKAVGEAKKTYMRNPNVMSKWIAQLEKTHPVLGTMASIIAPFPKVAFNMMMVLYEYSPAGIVSVVRDFQKYKGTLADIEETKEFGKKVYELEAKVDKCESNFEVAKIDYEAARDAAVNKNQPYSFGIIKEKYEKAKKELSDAREELRAAKSELKSIEQNIGTLNPFFASDESRKITKSMLGTAFWILGIIGGALGAFEYDEEAYSIVIHIGDFKMTIDSLAPAISAFLLGVAMSQKNLNTGERFKLTLDTFSDMTIFSQLNSIISYNDSIGDYALALPQDWLLQYIPNIAKQFAKIVDPTKKSYSGMDTGTKFINRLAAAIPGASLSVPSKVDPYTGEKDNIGYGNAVSRIILPFKWFLDDKSAFEAEAYRVGQTTKGLAKEISFNGKDYKLNPQKYQQYAMYRGQAVNVLGNELIRSKAYIKASDEEKAKMISSMYTKATLYAKALYWGYERPTDPDKVHRYAFSNYTDYKTFINLFDAQEIVYLNKKSMTTRYVTR